MSLAYQPAPFPCPITGCDVFPFDTAVELADHMTWHYGRTPETGNPHVITSRPAPAPVITSRPAPTPAPARRFVTVDNGFGGTTTVRPPKPADQPTAKQVAYLRTLLAEREGIDAAEAIRDSLNRRREAGQLTRVVVSEAIDRLVAIRRPRREAGTPQRFDRQLPDVPAGHYAIASTEGAANAIAFYRVDRPTEGDYAGGTFVKRIIGGRPDSNVPRGHVAGILARIVEAGVAESQLLYRQEIGTCAKCNRRLSNDYSRAVSYGPECIKHV